MIIFCINYIIYLYNLVMVWIVTRAATCGCKRDSWWVRFPLEVNSSGISINIKYFHFPRSSNEAKSGAKFRHLIYNVIIWRKVENGSLMYNKYIIPIFTH